MRNADPTKVNADMARLALDKAKDAQSAYSQYIILHYRATGSLAPGCDAKDLVAWYIKNTPVNFQLKGGKIPESENVDPQDYCPKCQELLPENPGLWKRLHPRLVMNSLSRRDNKTYICNDCGNAEAMADYLGITDKAARASAGGVFS
jgi:hypothetical protein